MVGNRYFYDRAIANYGWSFSNGTKCLRGVYFKFDLSGYRQILFDTNLFDEMEFNPAYVIIILRSFVLAVSATIISLIIGFPAAYFISRQPDNVKNILIFLVTIPFWTNLLVRTFAWIYYIRKRWRN